MLFPSHILKSINQPADIIQFAKDGKYEEAWIINLNEQQPNGEEIEKYIQAEDYDKLIVEYIWNPDIDEERYVLTVIHDEGCLEKDKFQFVKKCFNIFYDQLSFEDLINRIDQDIVGHEFLFQYPAQRIRLGVFNHWFSVGPIELWDMGEELNQATLENKIKNRPEVERSNLNYQGLAFIYNFDGSLPGPYYVFKTPCCHKEGNDWVVDTSLIYAIMKLMLI